MNDMNNIPAIPKEKLAFANLDDRLTDKKFDSKPVSYFKDAWIRFRKNKASIAAAIIIILIILYALIVPLIPLITGTDASLMDPLYKRMSPVI